MSSHANRVVTRKITGKGADFEIFLGFKARWVRLENETTQGSVLKTDTMDGKFARVEVAAGDKTFVDNVMEIQGDRVVLFGAAAINVAGESIHLVAAEGRNE